MILILSCFALKTTKIQNQVVSPKVNIQVWNIQWKKHMTRISNRHYCICFWGFLPPVCVVHLKQNCLGPGPGGASLPPDGEFQGLIPTAATKQRHLSPNDKLCSQLSYLFKQRKLSNLKKKIHFNIINPNIFFFPFKKKKTASCCLTHSNLRIKEKELKKKKRRTRTLKVELLTWWNLWCIVLVVVCTCCRGGSAATASTLMLMLTQSTKTAKTSSMMSIPRVSRCPKTDTKMENLQLLLLAEDKYIPQIFGILSVCMSCVSASLIWTIWKDAGTPKWTYDSVQGHIFTSAAVQWAAATEQINGQPRQIQRVQNHGHHRQDGAQHVDSHCQASLMTIKMKKRCKCFELQS